MLLSAAVLCTWLGLGALAFATRRHYARATGAPIRPRERLALHTAGWPLLGLALVLALARDGAAFGALLWVSLLGMIGLPLVLLLAYRPGLVFRISGAAALCALAAACARKP